MKQTQKLLALAVMVLLLLPLGLFSSVGAFDQTRVIYAYQDAIVVEGATAHSMDGDPRYMFEIPAQLSEVTIVPLKNYAAFQLFDGTKFRFGKINDDTYGIFTIATLGENPTPASLTIINPVSSFWSDWPSWAQWGLEYIFFGWLWMRWF